VTLPLKRWLLRDTGYSSWCEGHVEARNSPESARKTGKRKTARRLKEARVRSNGRTRAPAMTFPLKRWLLRGTGYSNWCEGHVEARNSPESARKNGKAKNRETT
jgi:hypothetical protein